MIVISEWILQAIGLLAFVLFVLLIAGIALFIISELIEKYYRRLIGQLGITDIIQFGKEYNEWKDGREKNETPQ